MVINSLENKRVKTVVKLKTKKMRDELGLFVVEGEHLVLEAFKNNLIEEYFVLENNDFDFAGIKNFVTEEVMKKMTSLNTPSNVLAICKKKTETKIGNKVLLLDDLQDPGNLGTIIRSAVAFGFDTVVLSPNSVDFYNPKVLRSAQGMNFNLNILVRNLATLIEDLKDNEYNIIGTNLLGGKDLEEVEDFSKIGLIIGNEGSGVKPELLEKCQQNIFIKMDEKCESLNAGVAASIIMYKFSK